MFYTRLQIQCDGELKEILTAELADIGFDTFLETETGLEAYVEDEKFDKDAFAEIKQRYSVVTSLNFLFDRIEKKNWNEEWENNYEPIIVEDKCLIRAGFHKIERSFPHEIIITPKMSFGTGHHQTTYLMIKAQMSIDHVHKRVMDAGCGTAILSIMASKLGATKVEAFDIDEWSVVNGKENIEINQTPNINIRQGKIDELNLTGPFDIILANINKNVLLDEIRSYAQVLKSGGLLLLSGFYTHDIDDLRTEGAKYSLTEVRRDERESWASLLLRIA